MFEVFFLFPSPPQKRVQERVAALALPRQSGNTLLIHLGWGACCQSERRLRSLEKLSRVRELFCPRKKCKYFGTVAYV